MGILKTLQHPVDYWKVLLKWCVLGAAMGVIGGLIGAGFHHTLQFVTQVREHNSWIIFLLPVSGLLSVGLYRISKMTGNRGTNEIIDAILENKQVNPMIAPVIFLASSITHLFGGSGGREGAALQLGGSTASLMARLLKMKENERTVLIMSGMSAVFAGLFGTPLTACLFTMEFSSVGKIFTPALLPCYFSAYAASRVSLALGVHPETYPLETVLEITPDTGWRLLVLAALIGVMGIVMVSVFHGAEHHAKKWIPNAWVRIAVGGAVVTVLTLLVGDHRFNGAGMHMALEAVAGHADWYSFLLKMVFTAVTLAAGFKGGEIVPTFCVGATFGCLAGGLLGLDPGIAAAMGLVGLFCGATNSPITSVILSIEMFGSGNLYGFALVCVISFVIANNWSLFSSQVMRYPQSRLVAKRHRM